MKIGMTSVLVNNPIEAFQFYTQKLGFVEVMYMEEHQLAIVAAPDDPKGTALMLEPIGMEFAKTFQQTAYEKGLPVIVFSTNTIYEDFERLKNAGVNFKQEPKETDWGILAVFDDTCGNYIQLHQEVK